MSTYNALTIKPAYGRDYKSAADAIAAWNEGKDFVAAQLTRTYVNKSDLINYPHNFTHLRIRYKQLTEVVELELKELGEGKRWKLEREL